MPFIAALALAACGSGEPRPPAGGVSETEAHALDDAAAMIDDSPAPESVPAERQSVP